MAQYICKLTPVRLEMLTAGPTERESEIVSQHFDYWSDLARKDIAILLGRTQTTDARTFGIAIFNAESQQHAEQIAQKDPAISNHVMHAEIFPYRIAIFNPENAFPKVAE